MKTRKHARTKQQHETRKQQDTARIPQCFASFLVFRQDSSKGGVVETGCSGLHSIIGCFTI